MGCTKDQLGLSSPGRAAYVVVVAEPVVTVIGDDDAGLLGLDGGVREVGGVAERALGDGLEQRRLSDVGKSDLVQNVSDGPGA